LRFQFTADALSDVVDGIRHPRHGEDDENQMRQVTEQKRGEHDHAAPSLRKPGQALRTLYQP
jgi:hypothetical protein